MESEKPDVLYDAKNGDNLLNVARAAAYLDYNPISLYRLVRQGVLKPRRVGKTLLFSRTDLDRYKLENAWAARKAGIKASAEPIEKAPSDLEAEISVDFPGGILARTVDSFKGFSWEKVPLIRAQVDSRHGNIPFDITVKGPDGATWTVRYEPPNWLDKLAGMIRGKR